jgi:hypothetical protein
MYTLQVIYPDATKPRESHRVDRAGDVLARIPELLKRHDGCQHIVVMLGDKRLFAVDCIGNRID